MKPRGLTNAHAPDEKAYAVVQLRQDNKLGTLYNMVGFQTKLKYAEQVRIFRTIPGLENAEFARLGGLHRNTFLNSPKLLDERLRLKADPRLRFAGQITGVEGYVESAAMGLMAGRMAAAERRGERLRGPAADDRPWRADQSHHRRPYRDDRPARLVVPADECQFRPVPAGATDRQATEPRRARHRPQARLYVARARGFRGLAWRCCFNSRRMTQLELPIFSNLLFQNAFRRAIHHSRNWRRNCETSITVVNAFSPMRSSRSR